MRTALSTAPIGSSFKECMLYQLAQYIDLTKLRDKCHYPLFHGLCLYSTLNNIHYAMEHGILKNEGKQCTGLRKIPLCMNEGGERIGLTSKSKPVCQVLASYTQLRLS